MSNTRLNDDFDYSAVMTEVMTPAVSQSSEVVTDKQHIVDTAKKAVHPFLVAGAAGTTIAASLLPFDPHVIKSFKSGFAAGKGGFFLANYSTAFLALNNSTKNSWFVLANQRENVCDNLGNIIPQPYLLAAAAAPFIGFFDTAFNTYFMNRSLLAALSKVGVKPEAPSLNYKLTLGTLGFSSLFTVHSMNAFCLMGTRPFVTSLTHDYIASDSLESSLASCAVSAAVHTVVGNPVMVAHKQRLSHTDATTLKGPSVRDAVKELWSQGGVPAFYRGAGRSTFNTFIIYGILSNIHFDQFFSMLLKLPMEHHHRPVKSPTLFQPASSLKIEEVNSNAVADSSTRPSRIEEPEDEPVSIRMANSMN